MIVVDVGMNGSSRNGGVGHPYINVWFSLNFPIISNIKTVI